MKTNHTTDFHEFSEAILSNGLLKNDFTPYYSDDREEMQTIYPFYLKLKRVQHATSVEVEELQQTFSKLNIKLAFNVSDEKLIVLAVKKEQA